MTLMARMKSCLVTVHTYVRSKKNLIGAVFSAADLLGLLEIEREEKAYVKALAADSATNRELKEEQACEIASAEARGAEVIGATLRAVHNISQLEIGRGEGPNGL